MLCPFYFSSGVCSKGNKKKEKAFTSNSTHFSIEEEKKIERAEKSGLRTKSNEIGIGSPEFFLYTLKESANTFKVMSFSTYVTAQ